MKRELLSSQKFQRSSLRKFSKEIFCIVACAFIFLLSSCNNLAALKGRLPSSTVSLSDPSSGAGGSFRLNAVYASQQFPGTMYDMIGADAQFDSYCPSLSACVCEYTYVSPGIGTMTDQGEVKYQESNLIRCENVVPSSLSFDVKLVATGSGDYSNTIAVNLASGGFVNTNYVDLTKEEAYQPVKRFQCRKREFIKNPLSVDMIDPLQSEDPKIVYPFNFYTSNVAGALWQIQQSSTQEWDCTLTPTHDRSLHWWANPNVYSASTCTSAFCADDAELMFARNSLLNGKITVANADSDPKKRSSFSVAKQAYGVFQVPVKAAVGPNDYVSSKYDIIGYAARPIPNASGSSSCPSITLPTNASWVKLWNFRATDITPPKYVTGSSAMLNSGIACNTVTGVFPSCDNPGATSMAGENTDWRAVTLASVTASPTPIAAAAFYAPVATFGSFPSGSQLPALATAADTLASRVAVLTSGNMNACYNIASMGNGQEVWEPSPFGFAIGTGIDTIATLPWNVYAIQLGDPSNRSWGSCGTTVNWVDHVLGSMNNVGCGGNRLVEDEPSDTNLTTATLSGNNYTDQIFVVTSPSVNDTSMRNQAVSVSDYKPVTYRTNNDCSGASRATGGVGGVPCPSNKEIHWDINIKDVGSPNGGDQYPLCVLQFTE